MNSSRSPIKPLFAVAMVAAFAAPLPATELILKNDSMTDASSVTPCVCFIQGDIPAVWLTAPLTGKIVGVQVFWNSQLGSPSATQEQAVRLYDGGTYPTPGAVLQNDGGGDAEIQGPVLSPGIFNEFRHLDQAQTTPLSVSVSAGQTFVVGLEIANQSSGGTAFTPSVTYDANCQSGKTGMYHLDMGMWVDSCTFGSGDWVIRAILDTDQPVPAVSHWGLVVLGLVVMAAGTVIAGFRRLPDAA